MFEEYTTQTTETDREIMLMRLYDELEEDLIEYQEWNESYCGRKFKE